MVAMDTELLSHERISRIDGFLNLHDESFCMPVAADSDVAHPLDLHSASNIGDTKRVRELIGTVSLDVINHGKWTALMYAAHNAQLEVVETLLQAGADSEIRNAGGLTALLLAASCGHEDVIALLAKAKCDLNAVDDKGLCALAYASRLNHAYAVKLLLTLGANANLREPSFGFTPFLVACAEGHEMCVQHFLDHNCDPDSKLFNGQTAKMLAMCNNHIKVASMLDAVTAHRKNANALPRRNSGKELLVGPNVIAALLKNRTPQNALRQKQNSQSPALDKIDPVAAFMDQLRLADGDISKVNILAPPAPMPQSLAELFEGMQLQKYYSVFEEHQIDLTTFMELTDSDLKEIGIKLLGPRKKMLNAICRLQAQCPPIGNVMEQAVANYYKAVAVEQSKKAEQAAKELDNITQQLDKQTRKTEAVERLCSAQRAATEHATSCIKDAKRCVQDLYLLCQRSLASKISTGPLMIDVLHVVESHASKIAISLDQCLLKFVQVTTASKK